MKSFRYSVILLVLVVLASCSVKEDRSDCPCWLRLDLHPCLDVTGDVYVTAWDDDGENRYFRNKVHVLDYASYYDQDVPRGLIHINVYTSPVTNVEENHRIIVPLGEDFDPLYVYSNYVDCDDEFYVDTVRLHKQFANVFIKLEKSEKEDYPYEFFIESNVCGVDMFTLLPIEGKFRYDIPFNKEDVGMFTLSRQFENTDALTLNIRNKGVTIETINLGEMARAMGYSWETESLEDLYIGVDYADSEVSISISDWGDGQKVDVIL